MFSLIMHVFPQRTRRNMMSQLRLRNAPSSHTYYRHQMIQCVSSNTASGFNLLHEYNHPCYYRNQDVHRVSFTFSMSMTNIIHVICSTRDWRLIYITFPERNIVNNDIFVHQWMFIYDIVHHHLSLARVRGQDTPPSSKWHVSHYRGPAKFSLV